jgi:hypothetical protein
MTTTIKIIRNDRDVPKDKLADAELHFTGGELDGLKFLGFAVWRGREGEARVTFPARPFIVHGERRNFALVRATGDATAEERLRELVLQAYKAAQQIPADRSA